MLTADYIGTPLPSELGGEWGVFAKHLEVDLIDDPFRAYGNYFGLAGGRIDAPNCMPSGSHYWYGYDGGGFPMPSSFRRD